MAYDDFAANGQLASRTYPIMYKPQSWNSLLIFVVVEALQYIFSVFRPPGIFDSKM